MRPFGEASFGEPEYDANTALTDLDKGLRSHKIGEQCEAIVRFPVLFEKYPFPILINTAFLKLADVFRTGSNFLRLWVLRVFQRSDRHLDKIINVDEFIKRIFSVIHSNDPVARALTLRILGSLADIVPERKQVHHAIRVALDSNDKVEVTAAIYAASCLAKRSKTFGTTMCTKIADMVQKLSTPLDLKLSLIPIFQHMHHDIGTATLVKKLCQDLLNDYPSEEFVTTILHTLSQLAASTITKTSDHVSFLLGYLRDPRKCVQLCVLMDLKVLATRSGYLWGPLQLSHLLDSMRYCEEKSMQYPSNHMAIECRDKSSIDNEISLIFLDVINNLTSSPSIVAFLQSNDSMLWKQIKTSIVCGEKGISLKAIQIVTNMVYNWNKELDSDCKVKLLEMACQGVESVLTQSCEKGDDGTKSSDLRQCLKYGVMLCQAMPSKCTWFCSLILSSMTNEDILKKHSQRMLQSLCEALGAVGSFDLGTVQEFFPSLLEFMEKEMASNNRYRIDDTSKVLLVVVVLQIHLGYAIEERVIQCIQKILISSNCWVAYKIGRSALRYGQPRIAKMALSGMSELVSSESYHFWIESLVQVSQAEEILSDRTESPDLLHRVKLSTNKYIDALACLKAASSPALTLQFQTEFVRVRTEMLMAFSNLISYCNVAYLSPPPMSTTTMSSRDEYMKSGRVVTQLRKSIKEFQCVAEMYKKLYQTAFDADEISLLNIQTLQRVCILMCRFVEGLVYPNDHPLVTSDDEQAFNFCESKPYLEVGSLWGLTETCSKCIKVWKCLKTKYKSTYVVTIEHANVLKRIAQSIIETPPSYPRFYFQTLQSTKVKIAVSPQPRVLGETVSVIFGHSLALKVEGVIQQNQSKVNVYRKPKSIRISVTCTPSTTARSHPTMDINKVNQEPYIMVKEVEPHRDFFSAQFLVPSTSGGVLNVTVDASIMDNQGQTWVTGPRANLSVKVYDETGGKSGLGSVARSPHVQLPSSSHSSQHGMPSYVMVTGSHNTNIYSGSGSIPQTQGMRFQ